ncbi:MAG TPA: hypothetical protein VKU00_30385 [Chthonomonadaceae bacterium]|nr:hypothetical protein [Chthonomonadaceae bacterium]
MNKPTLLLNVPDTSVPEETRSRFIALAAKWRKEVEFLSSMTQMIQNPAYQEIIGMGPVVIPLLLQELVQEPDWWFAALQKLTGQNPVRPEQQGNLQAMASAWLQWAKAQGYTC